MTKVYGPYTAALRGEFLRPTSASLRPATTPTSSPSSTRRATPRSTTASSPWPDNPGPTIGGVYVLPASGVMSWNAVDPDGVAGATLKVDGVSVSKVYGPTPPPPG